jgi:hypothetical protein
LLLLGDLLGHFGRWRDAPLIACAFSVFLIGHGNAKYAQQFDLDQSRHCTLWQAQWPHRAMNRRADQVF